MPKTEIAVAELIWNMISGKTGAISKVDYKPQKPPFPFGEKFPQRGEEEQPLERAIPETQGISSEHLARFLKELAVAAQVDIHQILILRHGKVICECGFEPYRPGIWHVTHSLCKSVTGMAVGMLVEEGLLSLSDRVIDLFTKKRNLLNIFRQKDVTVEHLLTMSSRVAFNEAGVVTGNDWVKSFLESGLSAVPGSGFEYNSLNSYMLSAIVTELTGESMMEYLKPRLWEPLGIRKVFWEACPQGITKGGWGLFLCPEDAAKLGQLYLQKGNWKGKQLISGEWVERSVVQHRETPSVMSSYGYGYQLWMGGREGSFNYNGMLGQNVLAYPDLDMVIVTNAGSKELFQNCYLLHIVKEYFEEGFEAVDRLPEEPHGQMLLQHTIEELEGKRTGLPVITAGGWGKRCSACTGSHMRYRRMGFLNGRVYELEQKSVGLMPLLMQVFHNNFTDGISRIGFTVCSGRLFLHITEGEAEYELEVGFAKAAVSAVVFHGESYLIGVKGDFSSDEDARMVLKLDFAFLEEACRRKAKMFFEEERIEIQWDETPGKEVITEGLESIITPEGKGSFLLNSFKDMGGLDVFRILVERTVQPICTGAIFRPQ